MPVARLRIRVTSRWIGDGPDGADDSSSRDVDTAGSRLLRGAGRLLAGLGRIGGGTRLWVKAAIVLAPALFTLGKFVVGLAGGILALGAVVTAAAAPWVGLAVTAARNADEMGRAGDRFQRGARAVGTAWMDLARRTAPLTLGPVTDVLNGIAAAIPKLEPLVRQVAPDFAQMGRDIGNWLSGRGLDRFLQNVQDYGVPAFRNLVDAARDAIPALGIMFRQAAPLARDIAREIQQGAAAMRGAAEGGGVARWLNDWRANLPVVNRFLREASETIRTMGQLLNDTGPGVLNLVSTGLSALNALNPSVLMGIVTAYASGRFIIGLAAALRAVQAARALQRLSFVAQGAALLSTAGALNAAAATLSALATALSGLAARLATRRVTVDSSALDRIREIWEGVPKRTSATATVNVDLALVALMGINSTWVTLVSNLASAPVFTARADVGIAIGVGALVLTAWLAVRAVGLAVAPFRAIATAGTATVAMNAIIVAWARVRAMATIPVVFTATATPGNVAAVAASIVAAWARVRAAAAVRPVFTATAVNTVSAGAAVIVAAWARVTSMPRNWTGVGIVSPGNVPGASSAIISAWMRLYGLGRSWHGVATCSFSGGFGGIGISVSNQSMQGGVFVLPGTGGIAGALNDAFGFGDSPFPDIDITTNPQGGDLSNPGSGFGSGTFGNAAGGPIGATGDFATGRRGGKTRHVHIEDDIWIRNERDLVDLLETALA